MDFSKSPFTNRKVNLIVGETEIFGEKYPTYTLDDQAFVDEVKAVYQNCRIFVPGTMGTADWKPGRVNIQINRDGIVEDIYEG